MSDFGADWLALREPLDAGSRAWVLGEDLRAPLAEATAPWLLDLATGTGANVRFLAPRLGDRQHWLLVDRDPRLLAALPGAMRTWAGERGYSVAAVPHRPAAFMSRTPRRWAATPRAPSPLIAPGDLAIAGAGFSARLQPLALDLAAGLDRLPLAACRLVTASALLDLVSESWLEDLAGRCRAAGAAVLLALTYDGRMELRPAESGDEEVQRLVNRHQGTDKGFGPALGPAATETAARLFSGLGYRVRTLQSDWRLGPAARAIQEALLAGWAQAARAIAPASANRLDDWQRRRLAHIAAGLSHLVVGHRDLLALPR